MSETKTPPAPATQGKLFDVLYQHRFRELDGLRGIAALAVGIDHGFGTVMLLPASAAGAVAISRAAGIINGATAVDLFFIMSGFFLTGMLENAAGKGLPRYYARRLIRLVPPAIAAVAVLYIYAITALAIPPTSPTPSSSFTQFYTDNHHIAAKDLLLNVLLIRHTLNPPLWTIRIEVATSILFPALFFAKNLLRAAWYRAALLLALLAIAFIIGDQQKLGIDVFQYLYMFYAGALIRDYGQAAAAWPRPLQYSLAVLFIIGLLATGEYVPTNGLHPFSFDLPTTICGAGLITLIAHGAIPHMRAWFTTAPVQFLGRISYSFYLINWLVVRGAGDLAFKFGLAARIGIPGAITLIAISSSIAGCAAAYLLHLAVEKPAVALSRQIGRAS